MKKVKAAIFLVGVFFLITSCKKKVVEILPVLEVVKDYSLGINEDIISFSFPNEVIGFCTSKENVYKTIDGGNSWGTLSPGGYDEFKNVAFFNENSGAVMRDDDLFITQDGGVTWTQRSGVDFFGISPNGIGVVVSQYYREITISTTNNNGESFANLLEFNFYSSIAKIFNIRVTETALLIVSDEGILSIDLLTGEKEQIYHDASFPRDIYLNDEYLVVVGEEGDR